MPHASEGASFSTIRIWVKHVYRPHIFHKELTVLEAVRLLIDATNEQLAKGQLTLFEGQESGSKKELAELRRITPAQKIAPVKFEIKEGKLMLAVQSNATERSDHANITAAREELLRRGEKLIKELERSNCDRRLIEQFQYVKDLIDYDDNIVKIGLSNMSCDLMCDACNSGLPEAINAMLRAHTRGVDMFAAQFPEWNKFVQNAVESKIDDTDAILIAKATDNLILQLEAEPRYVDPKVPATLSRLNRLIRRPGVPTKRAAFAMLRSLENLVSKVFSFGSEFLDQTTRKTIDNLSSIAAKAVVLGLLTMAVSGATSIAPVAEKVHELKWLKEAVELVQKQVDRLRKE